MDDTSKTCYSCKTAKPPDDFSFKNKKTGNRNTVCKTCHKQYAKEYHQKNKERTRKSRMVSHKKWRTRKKQEAKDIVDAIKSNPCTDCQQSFNPWQMQFDHREADSKQFNVAHGVHWTYRRKYSIEQILKEISKCDLVCANCHANRTHQRRIEKE